MPLDTLGDWVYIRRRPLAYILVAAIVSIWTLLRVFTKATIFDMVSQQVIVRQWLHGGMSVAHMGQTAYVPKMLLLYVPLDFLPGSPRLKLILLTLAINIATFVLIGLLAERLLRMYGVRVGSMFYLAFIWLSVVAGSMFWIQFANSRNLEVAGGLLLLYMGIRFLERRSRKLAVATALFGSLLFFDDPLQAYMTALPLAVYASALAGAKRKTVRTTGMLCGLLLVAFGLSKLLFVITEHWLHLTFTDTGSVSTPAVSVPWLGQSITGSIKANLSLLAGADDAGRLRELTNLVLLLVGLVGVACSAVRWSMPRRLLLLAGCIWAMDVLVYMASGQALQGGATSRYLVMTAPVLLLLFGAIRLPKASCVPAMVLICGAVAVNVTMLGAALIAHWNTGFPQDDHLASVQRFVRQQPHVLAYASTDTAMPIQYLYDLPASELLPIACLNSTLVRTHFSMDREFAARAADHSAVAVIIFDRNAITNAPNVCTADAAIRQFGVPKHVSHTDDGSSILYYSQQSIRLPD